MRNRNIKEILNMQINPEDYLASHGKSALLEKQVAGVCIWFCAAAFLWFINFQALRSFNFSSQHVLTDYGSLYGSARLANLHVNPYKDNPLVFHIIDIDRHGPDTPLQGSIVNAINLNPPLVLYPFRLLARLNPDQSYIIWTLISAGLFLSSIILITQMYPAEKLRIRILWILAMGAVWYTFQLGQIYMVLLFCASLAWWGLRKHNWLIAGISIGVICAIKPNFLVWPGLLIAGKSKKIGFTAFVTTGVLSAIPLLLQGPIIYREWIAACRGFNGYELPGNASLLATFSRAGFPNIGIALTVLFLTAVTIWVFVTKPESLYASEIGILASLIAGPISWLGYTLMLVPAMYGKSMNSVTRLGCVLLCIPVWVIVANGDNSRLTYILFWAPNMYAIGLIAYGAVRSGEYREACEGSPEPRPRMPAACEDSDHIPLEIPWKYQSFAPFNN
ncbi:MAG TPA: glycosyltransferase family 87 protein [Candidatus Saccharimonadales bacterium]|nr:glycosyltransferase family 87 protein [Candidatus Saccharimonadales bacterium]